MTKPDDCELLELAAKAAELRVLPYLNAKNEWYHRNFEMYLVNEQGFPIRKWNPIDDNNTAFLLAVRLEMEVNLNSGKVKVCDRTQPKPKYLVIPIEVIDDVASATRRAIVRAAAEIGRSMK